MCFSSSLHPHVTSDDVFQPRPSATPPPPSSSSLLSIPLSLCSLLSEDPSWGSCSLGVFICLDCSGIHRNIPEISKVKSLNLSNWEDHELQVRPQKMSVLFFFSHLWCDALVGEWEPAASPPSHSCYHIPARWVGTGLRKRSTLVLKSPTYRPDLSVRAKKSSSE